MTSFPGSPRILKGGIVLLDAETAAVQKIIVLQYNADTLSRTFQIQAIGQDGTDRSQAFRVKAPPVESIKLDAEIDATDQLELATPGSQITQYGITPQLAVLETIVYPKSTDLDSNNALASAGTLEIVQMQAPLTLFVWGPSRIVPVRLTDLSVTEEAFDVNLNPMRAKVSLGMRVLSVYDVGFDHKAGQLYMTHQRLKEQLAVANPAGTFGTLGIQGIP
ncbi:MAG TPA: hypothetical protein VFP58_12140 [Candidatus Eisenbacteria bacterium]|nr:hypothetical protein [Candidatus Eisenbacteria bacterium]